MSKEKENWNKIVSDDSEEEMDNGPTTSSFEILCKTLGIKTIAALDATKESVCQYSTCSRSKNQHLVQLAAIYEPLCLVDLVDHFVNVI